MSWNCNGKLVAAINHIGQYTSTHEIIHISESKHNSYTSFKIPDNFQCISKPGSRNKDVDRGGNIIFMKMWLHKYLRSSRYYEWGSVLWFNSFALIFIYLVPDNSVYFRDQSFTELYHVLRKVEESGNDGYLVGDQNGRMGKLDFNEKCCDDNIDKVGNPQCILLKSIYNKCGFYPVNHLIVDAKVYTGNFIFMKGDKKSQIDFFVLITILMLEN